MQPETQYGLLSSHEDEKLLMQRVNAYLATMNRTTSKAKQPSLLEARLPFVLKYFYWNLNKDVGTWLEIHANQDARGVYFFPERPDCAWLVRVRINVPARQAAAEAFIAGLLAAVQVEHVVLREGENPPALDATRSSPQQATTRTCP